MTDTEQDIHDGIEEAVEAADVSKLRKALIRCMRFDADRRFYFLNKNVSEVIPRRMTQLDRFEFFNGELDYASRNVRGLIDEHDGAALRPPYGWNYGYLREQFSLLSKNFSLQRIELVKRMLLVAVFLRELKNLILFLAFFSFGSWTYSLYREQNFSLSTALLSALGTWCLWLIVEADAARKKK